MSDTSTTIKQYNPPDKRTKKSILSSSSSRSYISEKVDEKSKQLPTDQFIEAQVGLISKNNIESWINSLTSFHNRHSKSIYNHQVANWLKKELEISGYKDRDRIEEKDNEKYKDLVYFHQFKENGIELKNVICHKQGNTKKIILICGHYDTILGDNLEDAVSRAPGANDNASGVAVILEIARILFSLVDLKYSIRLVLFSGEEQGLRGSEYYADSITKKNVDLSLVINLDMIGVPDYHAINMTPEKEDIGIQHDSSANKKTIQIDIDKEFKDKPSCNEIKENDVDSDKCGKIMEEMCLNYTDLQPVEGSVYSSDYCPFEARGYVVIGAYDRSAEPDNPHYHSSSDLPANLDFDYLKSVTKMVLATILHLNRENLL
ncbi:MAG TPA: M28 family metallopeptidase [Nitrososphaeraceae archaeon]|nr:M28 family metallopeptidase [Nitrososphaeraceae archaeon]